MSETEIDPRLDYLNIIQRQNAITQQMLHGVKLVMIGGVEGIQEIAKIAPEAILDAIDGMARIINNQQEQINGLVERWFEEMDNIDQIHDKITEITNKL